MVTENNVTTISYKEYSEKIALTRLLLSKEEREPNVQSKLKYAINKLEKKVKNQVSEIGQEAQELIEDIQKEFASVYTDGEKKGIFLTDSTKEGSLLYTPTNAIARDKKIREILTPINKKEITIEDIEKLYFLDTERIKTFDPYIVEELEGFFLPEGSLDLVLKYMQ
jgi:hypothetical protein